MRQLFARALGAVCGALLVGGCALLDRDGGESAAGSGEPDARADAGDAIAGDFLDAFVQLDGYAPASTTVRFARGTLADDALVAALARRMREAGYAVGVVGDEGAAGVVTHVVEASADGSPGDVHTLSIGPVKMRRRYVRDESGDWRPDGSLFVRGADASGIRLDERARGAGRPAPAPRPAPPAPNAGAEPDLLVADDPRTRDSAGGAATGSLPVVSAVPRPAPLEPVPTEPAPPGFAPPLGFDERSGRPVYSGLVTPALDRGAPPRNIMEIGDSNFTGLFDEFGNVDELVLTFANDSLVLGDRNKRLVRRAVERFDPERDLFSIVGCSLGPTSIPNGNEALALGRAHRVKEELLFAGVPQARIRDEGCWAGEASTKFPTRGVVLTHLRRAG